MLRSAGIYNIIRIQDCVYGRTSAKQMAQWHFNVGLAAQKNCTTFVRYIPLHYITLHTYIATYYYGFGILKVKKLRS